MSLPVIKCRSFIQKQSFYRVTSVLVRFAFNVGINPSGTSTFGWRWNIPGSFAMLSHTPQGLAIAVKLYTRALGISMTAYPRSSGSAGTARSDYHYITRCYTEQWVITDCRLQMFITKSKENINKSTFQSTQDREMKLKFCDFFCICIKHSLLFWGNNIH